jgi:catechol 2,3-dioxygenase-like lactoylglutathione lyase family enzyme
MIENKGVVHFTIAVSDTRRSEAFYRDVVGLKTVLRAPARDMVFMTAGGDYVILTSTDEPIKPNPGNDIENHHAFRVDIDKYDEAIAHVKSYGVDVFFEEDRREGIFIGRQCYFHDPDRNVIEISALERHGSGFKLDPAAEPPAFKM